MKELAVTLLLILSITLQDSCAVSPTNCDATEPLAGKALDLVNKGRHDGYLFQLLRVADAHLDKAESTDVYYLTLDVLESDCFVLSRKHWEDCKPDFSRRPTDTVIGQCKVIVATHSTAPQDLRLKFFNCTISSVSSAMANNKDSPILFDFFEDPTFYREQANKALEKYKGENGGFAHFRVNRVEKVIRARGGEGTKYLMEFSVRNCSGYHFSGHFNVFGFCRADLFYDVGHSDLETPKDITINCEVFNVEELRNMSGIKHLLGHHFSGGHKHPPPGKSFHHKSHKPGCPPPAEDKSNSEKPLFQEGDLPGESRSHQPHCGINRTHHHFHNHNSSEHHPHRHPPPGHHHHGHRPHGHHSHGHHPHGHHPHGHHPHGHHPHGHHPHHHPHCYDHGPCDPPPHNYGHHHPDHGPPPPIHGRQHPGHGPPPPPRHSEERGPDKGHFCFERRQIGYVYRLPPLKEGEVLLSPEANIPIFPMPNHNPRKPEIKPFPQSASDSCPGEFKRELKLSKFFASTVPK